MKEALVEQKILLIDDDEATRILINEILNDSNIYVIETGCGKEGLNLFKKHSEEIDLVLMDIKLPDCMGWDLVRQFRTANMDVPIVALSAINKNELKEKAEIFGFSSYLSKPFDIEDLERIVRFYLTHQTKTV
ncbi:MAG TPA: response regulator [Bacteroidales bacterium]